MNFEDVQLQIENLNQEKAFTEQSLETEILALRKTKKTLLAVEEAQTLIQKVAQTVQEQAHNQLADIVTHCLYSIFGDAYSFKIDFVRKRGKTEAQLLLINKEGAEIKDPCDEDSGGVMDVASFSLRLACLILSRPKLRKVLVLDEPFRFVSAMYREDIKKLLIQLSEDFNIQFIIVTHEPEYVTGKIIKM